MAIQANQLFWRHTGIIEGLNEKPACHRSAQAIVPPSPVRNPDRLFQICQFSGSSQPACEFVILQNRPTNESTKGLKDGTAAEDPRIAVENTEPPPTSVD